ncbi:fimbrial protein [Pseudomonas fluorescens]|uniref:fimbrial protein n=2 Tax=Pseudomonas fluorescens TaxID=294 RepID=UPI000937F1DE|nr:fimbrial protein [Pseudomonas fluorescens]
MKPLRLQLALLVFITTMMITCSTIAIAAENCEFNGNFGTEKLNFGANLTSDSLTISADTPNKTVVYQERVLGKEHIWFCARSYPFGLVLNPMLGTATSWSDLFPLGKTGLSYRIKLSSSHGYLTPPGSLPATTGANHLLSYIQKGDVTLEIVKSSTFAKKIKIEAGLLGSLKVDNHTLIEFNLANPIIFNTASCQTPSVPVDMGTDYNLNDFPTSGPTKRKVHFNIALNECQGDISKVTYSLKANTEVIDTQKGIVALSKGLKSAQGIGLQLMDDAGQPIALGTTYTFNGFTTTGTRFNIPLSASYYRLPSGELKAGEGNTDVTFIVNYL